MRAVTAVAVTAGGAGAILAVANIGSPVRTPLVILFLAVAPASAIAPLLGHADRLSRVVIAGTAAIVVNFLVAEIMLAAGLWSPRASVVVVTVVSVTCAAIQHVRVRPLFSRVPAPVRPAAQPPGPGGASAGDPEPTGPESAARQQARCHVPAWLTAAPRVSVVIPARNEARNLPRVFAALPAWLGEIVLVDGHSVDGTAEVARQLRPDIKIVSQVGQGRSDALLAGYSICTGDIIVTIDADGSADGPEILRLVGALVTGADFAKGSRVAAEGGGDTIAPRRRAIRTVSLLGNLALRTRYKDLCYGHNAFWSRHLPALAPDCPLCEAAILMNVRAARAGLTVQEVPCGEHPWTGRADYLGAARDGWQILGLLVRAWPAARVTAARAGSGPSAWAPAGPAPGPAADTDGEQPR